MEFSLIVFICLFLLSLNIVEMKNISCHCTYFDCEKDNLCRTDGVCYSLAIRVEDGSISKEFGCYDSNILTPPGRPFRCENVKSSNSEHFVKCCKNHMCNLETINQVTLLPLTIKFNDSSNKIIIWTTLVFIILAVVIFCVILIFLLVRRKVNIRRPIVVNDQLCDKKQLLASGTTLMDSRDEYSQYSGSGAGLPIFIQQTIARQIHLENIVGVGRFGEVWRGTWKSENVAVKIFHSREERSWFRESEIYQTVMLRHDNILGFIAADNKDNGTWTQLWLITDYHPNGSLFDYLNKFTVTRDEMLTFSHNIVSGLAHLHMQIMGTQGKPAIAHRDLKSKNILVKSNKQCCIADLGLSVKHDCESNMIDIGNNSRVGTARYMPPEVIDGTINVNSFESFKMADIYSLGLVYWEIIRRCNYFGKAEEYQLPYYNMVPSDPANEEMHKVVVVNKQRPFLSPFLKTEKIFSVMSQIMKETWYANPDARLSALRIKKTIAIQIKQNENQSTNHPV